MPDTTTPGTDPPVVVRSDSEVMARNRPKAAPVSAWPNRPAPFWSDRLTDTSSPRPPSDSPPDMAIGLGRSLLDGDGIADARLGGDGVEHRARQAREDADEQRQRARSCRA